MNRKKVDSIWLGISVFCFLLLAISFLLMPFGTTATADKISAVTLISGIVFWASIVLGIVAQCVLSSRRKAWYSKNRIKKSRVKQKIGLISFFKNTYAAIADIGLALSLTGLIAVLIVTQGTGYVCYVFISLFVFSFSMHCILNGKNYYYVINQDKMLQAIEKERANLSTQERKECNG